MFNKLVILVLIFSPVFAFSQKYPSADSANKLIMNGGDCSDRTFTKMEKPPGLKVPNKDYADSLGAYFTSHQVFLKNTTVKFHFVVTCHGEIRSVECETDGLPDKAEIKKAILLYANLWVAGRQNGYIDNAYVTLTMKFSKNTLGIEISQ